MGSLYVIGSENPVTLNQVGRLQTERRAEVLPLDRIASLSGDRSIVARVGWDGDQHRLMRERLVPLLLDSP
ncbi:MAG: hypothetical protein O3A46_11975, partial [Candidatus Poribacteria bacterium]|nr:hypothetical protein [Candidatus Poribacteria bacterium]